MKLQPLILIVESFFAQFKAITGSPKFITQGTKLIVSVSYFASSRAITEEKMNALGLALTRCLPKAYTLVELRLVQLKYPYLDASILGQYLAINASKYNLLRMKKWLFSRTYSGARSQAKNADLPTWVTGIKVELAGRLTTQRRIPRKTVSNAYKGSFTVSNKLNSSLDFSQYASKNKIGAYTMKVWLSQRNK